MSGTNGSPEQPASKEADCGCPRWARGRLARATQIAAALAIVATGWLLRGPWGALDGFVVVVIFASGFAIGHRRGASDAFREAASWFEAAARRSAKAQQDDGLAARLRAREGHGGPAGGA